MPVKKTMHIMRSKGGWAIKATPRSDADSVVYRTQKSAIEAARRLMTRPSVHEIVIHDQKGAIRAKNTFVLPAVQRPPVKSQLGTKAIEDAVVSVLQRRLGA